MRILITGAAGFIGFNFSKYLLKKNKFKIIGIDNLNNYYDVDLKKKRINLLKKEKNFVFIKTDLTNQKKLEKIFKKFKFDFVFNLAAQAGVRYSIEHPRKYIESNIEGFFNIIECSKKYKVKRLFYASSSSVYGENKNFPLNEKEKISPKNVYSLSKKINEEISSIYNNFYNVKSTGLRFFTVYGEWGRPDMMMLKFIDAFFKKKKFELFNYGNHYRDFTYIGDVVKIMDILLTNHKRLNKKDILNVCSNQPINLKKVINYLQQKKIRPQIIKKSLQKADILKTHGDNKKILRITRFKDFTDWKVGIDKTIKWYLEFYVKKKMNIIYIFNSSIPSYNANSLQVVNMCHNIAKHIGKITLITPNTGLKKNLSEHYGIRKNFNIIKIKKFNKFPQGFNYYLFSIYAIILGIKLKSDLYITRNYFTLFILLILRKKIIFEVHNSLSNEGRINNFIVKYFKILNSKNIVKLIFITNSVKEFFFKKYNIKNKQSLILSSVSNVITLLPEYKKKNSYKIGYFGLVNKSRGLDFLCKLSQIDLKNKYYLYGCSKDIKNFYAKKFRNNNIFFNTQVPHKKIKNLMSHMDLLILPYEKKVTASGNVGDIGNFTSPMKLFDYLASSKPIIASSLPVLKEVLVNKKNCIFVNSLNIFKWKLIIERILLNNSQKRIISRNNFFLAKKYTYTNRVKKMFKDIML